MAMQILGKAASPAQIKFDNARAKWNINASKEVKNVNASRQSVPIQSGNTQPDTENREARRLGLVAQTAIKNVLPEWTVPPSGQIGEPLDRAAEAHIAAACLGRKPLYYDSWGDFAPALAERLKKVLPQNTKVQAENNILYVYTTAAVKPILDADPKFYRPNGEDDFAAIRRASESGNNGELLGYGAREYRAPNSVGVSIYDDKGHLLFVYFSAPSADTEKFAAERARDISDYLGIKTSVVIDPNP